MPDGHPVHEVLGQLYLLPTVQFVGQRQFK